MSRTIVVWVVLLAVAALGVVWFFDTYERVTEKEWVGYSGEARRNQYLAAERLLARMGVSARHVRTIPELKELPANGTLVLPDRREALTPDARAALLKWVDGGGHLIVEDESYRVPDPILDAFGVLRRPVKAQAKLSPFEARLPHAPAPMKVEMHSIQSIEAPNAAVRVTGNDATHLLHFTRGRGQVTVLNDLDFLRNRSIGRLDHAEFLWQIVRFQPDTPALFVFDNPQRLSLLIWLRDNAWAVLAAAALVLAFWLWRAASRFGPVAPDPEPARRRLLDHLRASGRFQWSRGGGSALVEAAREAALRRVARAHPDFAGLMRSEQQARLVELFGIRAEDAHKVLAPAHPRTPGELMLAVGVYQRIQERLARRTK
ncbi:MAG TPA: DUF4350 domain-containing protein [Burkholderiales bacterium]|nr:DUF4350 domain-containing protein [Burkholderiales bacterium]